MRTSTSKITKNNVFAVSQDRVVVSMPRGTWLCAAQHLISWPAGLVHRVGSALKRAAQTMAAGADRYAEHLAGMLSGQRLCPQPVRREPSATTNNRG